MANCLVSASSPSPKLGYSRARNPTTAIFDGGYGTFVPGTGETDVDASTFPPQRDPMRRYATPGPGTASRWEIEGRPGGRWGPLTLPVPRRKARTTEYYRFAGSQLQQGITLDRPVSPGCARSSLNPQAPARVRGEAENPAVFTTFALPVPSVSCWPGPAPRRCQFGRDRPLSQ